jgi:DNA-binding transcriptional LysR family regulator
MMLPGATSPPITADIARTNTHHNEEHIVLETKQLLIFRTIVELGSFTRAGVRLGLSQPAISQQVRALEQQVGVPLLLRRTKFARPTPGGEVLLQYARQVLGKVDEVERALAAVADGDTGVVRVAAGGAACQYLLPSVLREFRARFPRVEIQVNAGHTTRTVQRLQHGEVDLGLVTLPVRADAMRVATVGRDELMVIVPPAHAWSTRRRIMPTDLAEQPIVLYERQSRATDLILRALLADGVFARVAMEIDHLGAAKEMVQAGLGVSMLPEWAVRDEVAAGKLVALSLGKTGLWRTWGLASVERPSSPLSLRALVRLCLERLPRALAAA